MVRCAPSYYRNMDFSSYDLRTSNGMLWFITLSCAIKFTINQAHATRECSPRSFGFDSFVCVCNATYCDTVDKVPKPPKNTVLVYTTSKAGHRFYQEKLPFNAHAADSPTVIRDFKASISIDSSHLKQEIVGFGGTFTDATGINILSLSEPAQKHLKEAYFSQNGLEYNTFRVPIGGTDFSIRAYSYDDDSPGDLQFLNFTLQPEDLVYKIPLIQDAAKMSQYPIKLVATSWSPPAWMKTNNDLKGFGWLKGPAGGQFYDLLAQYYIRFLQEYHHKAIDFWALTTQNEPLTGFVPFYRFNTNGFTPDMERIFVKQNLGPQLKASEFNSTKLLIYDHNRLTLLPYVSVIMADDDAKKYVDGIALHWYDDTITPPFILDIVHNVYPETPMLMTEACITQSIYLEKPVELGSWQRAETIAYYIIQNLQHWVTGWIDWNMVLDLHGGPSWVNNLDDAPVIVNNQTDEFYKQPMYYAFGHFSKCVPPGSVVLHTKQRLLSRGISSVAFKTPDSTIVLIVLNSLGRDVSVKINDLNFGSFHAKIPANALQTYLWIQN